MRKQTRIEIARKDILKTFDDRPEKVFTKKDIDRILRENRNNWRLPQNFNGMAFIEFLKTRGSLVEEQFTSRKYQHEKRYTWGEVSDFELAISFRRRAHFSHSSAAFLHGLTARIPNLLYINKEQSPKPRPKTPLTQEGLDRAFRNCPRTSKHVFRLRNKRLCLLAGKHTGQLEVGTVEGPEGESLPATKLERTLIDAAVRPHYSGGVHEVLTVYEAAKGRASTNVLMATLKRLDFVYPYHQVIGFYMQRAGYPSASLKLLKKPGFEWKFYLTHGMKKKRFDSVWRLFVPQDL